jgi:hypothetical protein
LVGSSEPVTLRHATIIVLAIATAAVACIDLSPPTGPASISLIQLPAGFVVRGDFMRDSAGTPAPPIVIQFNSTGHTIAGTVPQFFITDSAPVAHFDPVTGVLVGDALGTVHVLGQVGALQTPIVPISVTVEPTVLDEGTGALDTIRAPVSNDSTVVGSSSMPVIVSGVGDTGVQGVVVRYVITKSLASTSSGHPAVFITGVQGVLTTTDTTNSSGQATNNRINVRAGLLADVAVATGQKIDSVIVQANATYKGMPLAGSPVTFVFYVIGTIGP